MPELSNARFDQCLKLSLIALMRNEEVMGVPTILGSDVRQVAVVTNNGVRHEHHRPNREIKEEPTPNRLIAGIRFTPVRHILMALVRQNFETFDPGRRDIYALAPSLIKGSR